MKELSIEDKAKRYDKAIKKAESLYKAAEPMSGCNVIIETLFPELKESEDERIRKELLEHCKNQAKPYIQTGNKCPQIQSWIAWLEKQGEQKQEWSKDDEEMFNQTLKTVCAYGTTKMIDWLKSIKDRVQPQQQQDWSEEDEKYLNAIEKLITGSRHTGYNGVSRKDAVNWLKSLRPQNRWKPSECQLRSLQAAIDIIGERTLTGTDLKELLEQLKNPKEE